MTSLYLMWEFTTISNLILNLLMLNFSKDANQEEKNVEQRRKDQTAPKEQSDHALCFTFFSPYKHSLKIMHGLDSDSKMKDSLNPRLWYKRSGRSLNFQWWKV